MIRIIKDFFSGIKINIFKGWEKEEKFKTPLWFRILEYIAFRDVKYSDLSIKDKLKYMVQHTSDSSKIYIFLKTRLEISDFTLPLPKNIYKIVYSTDRKLKGEFLILFYSTLLSVQEGRGSELNALEKLLASNALPPVVRKIFNEWSNDIQKAQKTFPICLREKSKMFGEFESNIYYEVKGSGVNENVLAKILNHLEDTIQLDKAKRSIYRNLKFNMAFIFCAMYYSFCFVITDLIESFPGQAPPTDIQIVYNISKYLKSIHGIVTILTVLLLVWWIFRKYGKSDFMSAMYCFIPKLWEFTRFTELFLFIDSFSIFIKYMPGTEDKKIDRAINVVENSFIRGFFSYKLKKVRDSSERIENFFNNNKVVGDYSSYISIAGDFESKIERLNMILKNHKEEVLKKLPEILDQLVFLLVIFAVLIIVIVITRVEMWVSNPARFY